MVCDFGITAAIYVPTVVFYVCKFGDHSSQCLFDQSAQSKRMMCLA